MDLAYWHRAKRQQGWVCKIGGEHDGPCPMLPVPWRHPIWWWKMHNV